MASVRKGLERRAGFFAFSRFERLFLKKSAPAAERAGEKLGQLVYKLSRKHRERALDNLALAMPEMSEAARINLAQNCFRHFGRVFADFLRSSARTDEEILASTPLIGKEHLDNALAQ